MISGSLLAKLPKGWCILFMEDRLKDMLINQSTLWNYKKLLNPPKTYLSGPLRAFIKPLTLGV